MVEELGQTRQEKEIPEYNILEQNFSKLFYLLGAVTRPSASRKNGDEIERSLLTRAQRANLLERLKAIPKGDREKRKAILAEARVRDEIARQYLNQGEIRIEIPELGTQKAHYVVINPSESKKTAELDSKPTILLIPGVSNDIDPVAGLAQEIAFMGRKVIVVAYPDSTLGEITPEFAQKVVSSKSYEPHVAFYKEAIRKFRGKEGNLELWGFSGGAPILTEILTDPEFQEKTPNAVFLSPAGTTNQSLLQFSSGLAKEVMEWGNKLKSIARYSLVLTRKYKDKPQQESLKSQVWKSLIKKICSRGDFWNEARVREGGKIIIFSGKKDTATKSSYSEDELSKNPQVVIISDPEASHSTPLIEPHNVIQKVFNAQS